MPASFDPQDFSRLALLLDVDGTLLDIAPTPLEVVVPRDLPETLSRVRDRLEGALALVSGRTIAELDKFFAPLELVAIGGHGAEIRPTAGGPIIAGRATSLDAEFKQQLKDIAARHKCVCNRIGLVRVKRARGFDCHNASVAIGDKPGQSIALAEHPAVCILVRI